MQRQRRTAITHQQVPLAQRKSRGRRRQPGASSATDALQLSEISCIAEGPRWGVACRWGRGGFRHAPKLSPALEMLSSLCGAEQFRIANRKAKICDACCRGG